jgi:hypothetical protein
VASVADSAVVSEVVSAASAEAHSEAAALAAAGKKTLVIPFYLMVSKKLSKIGNDPV